MFRKAFYIILFLISYHYANCQTQVAHTIWKKKYYPNSSSLLELYQIDTALNRYNGVFKSFYKNGDLRLLGFYVYGVPIYTWKYYDKGKILKMTADYDTLRTKELTYRKYYNDNKKKKMEGAIRKDKYEGLWKYYYPNGKIKQKGEFKGSNKVGMWINYNEKGVIISEITYDKGIGHIVEYFILNGDKTNIIKNEGYLKNNMRDGEWKYYFSTGKLKTKGHYKKGKKTNVWQDYYKNSQLKSEGSYDNGMKVGLWTYYHSNGKISQKGAIVNNNKNGNWEIFDKEGKKLSDTNYEQESGKYKEYYPNGGMKVEGKLKSNKSHGEWFYYFDTGELKAKCDFILGEGKYIGYYKNGKKRMEGVIKDGERLGVWRLYYPNGKVSGYYKTIYTDDEKEEVKTNEKGGSPLHNYIIPNYVKINRKSRYFRAVTNEYRTFVASVGLPSIAFGYFPINLEYYLQERLGFEFTYTFVMQPSFTNINVFSAKELKTDGHIFSVKQKFYNKDTSFGMFYFAHVVEYSYNKHTSKMDEKDMAEETIFSYCFSIGSRWQKYANKSGLSVDAFAGIGIGYRQLDYNFDSVIKTREFLELNDNNIYLPIRLGLTVGFAL